MRFKKLYNNKISIKIILRRKKQNTMDHCGYNLKMFVLFYYNITYIYIIMSFYSFLDMS